MSARPATLPRRRWPRWLKVAGWSLLGVLGAAAAVGMFIVMFGKVQGVEFCPQTFERRSYAFYELPVAGIMVTSDRREHIPSTSETILTAGKFVTPPAGGQQDWHLVIGSRGPRIGRTGDASILIEYLDAQDAQEHYRWVKWSEDHSPLARVLWPAVQKLAIHELYVFIPGLFELAKAADDPAALKQQLDREIARCLLWLARRLQERGDQAGAIRVLDEAAPLDPDNEELRRARGTSRAKK